VEGRLEAAKDHVTWLREDPGYFFDKLGEIYEHRVEHVLDKVGKPHPDLNSKTIWDSIAHHAIEEAYTNLFNWGVVQEEITRLSALIEKHQASSSLCGDLPHACLISLLLLRVI
jgi:hypothetical protein